MKKKINIIVMVVLALTLAATALTMTACGSEPTVTGITLDTSSVDTVFDEGDNFDYTGLKVTATMSDETTKDIAIGDCEVSLPDMFTVGEKTVTVTYGDFNAEYTITIMHKCTQKCPVCGKCMDYECEDPVCAEKCGDEEGYETYTIEAEDSNVILQSGVMGALSTIRVIDDAGVSDEVKERNSDIVYIGNFSGNAGATIEYNIWADKDAKATLVVSICKRHSSSIFTQIVALMVNGEILERSSYAPASGTGKDAWGDFVDVNLGCIDLIGGQLNKITLMNVSPNVVGYNFDCIRLKTDATLGWAEDDLILADTDTSGYDAVVNMAYKKDFVMAEIYDDMMDRYGKTFPAYTDHMGGATAAGADGKCFDGTKLNGQTIDFDFYMISKGTSYIDLSMASPSGYTTDDLLANAKITLDGKEITKENIFISADASFSGRAGENGVTAPFVRVRIGSNGSEYNDLAAGAHKLTLQFIGDNAPDFDVISISPIKLGKYYTYIAISVDASSAKTDYITGEEFTAEGLIVKATKRDGGEDVIPLEECKITEPETETIGIKTVTVTYEKLTATYSIKVGMDMSELVQNVFEAEDEHVTYGPGHRFGTDPNATLPTVVENHVGNLSANVGATLTFRIDGGETGGTAQLYATVCKRRLELKFTDSMSITLNGTLLTSDAKVPSYSVKDWVEYEQIFIGEIELQPGENVIVFTVVGAETSTGFDFDNIMLVSEDTLGWYEAT